MSHLAPLISCVMPTKNRRHFLPQALRCFARRTLREAELILVDDGVEPVSDLLGNYPEVRYVRCAPPATTGEKLNIGIEASAGHIVQKLDDDDWYAPDFLETAYGLASSRETLVAWDCFLVLFASDLQVRHSGHGWTAGGTLVFPRTLWRKIPFRDLASGQDRWFVRDHGGKPVVVCAPEKYILVRHGANTWKHMKGGSGADEFLSGRELYSKSLDALVPPED